MHNLLPLPSRALTVSRVREMLMKHKQFVILSTALKPPKYFLTISIKITDHSHVCLVIT